ncbi:MAG: AraC family transcriptional regulator [Ruminococcaceae bacterium]|nr:AraC family transcriptional regulator [Oscillospiraceae bacterium]
MPNKKKERLENFFYDSTAFNTARIGPRHYHSLYEIYYLEKGVCYYLIEGKLFEMEEGDIVFIPKGQIHKTSYEDIHSRLLINCSGEYLENILLTTAFVYKNDKYSGDIYKILKNIEREYLEGDIFSESLIKGYMQQLLALVYRTPNKYKNTRQQNKYVKNALDILEKNFTADISLTATADEFGISAEHFSRIFKKETGLGFNEYLSILRLKKAESILRRNQTQSISDVAFSCGFNDSNYFCEKFKKVYGVSPLKYRKNLILKGKGAKERRAENE